MTDRRLVNDADVLEVIDVGGGVRMLRFETGHRYGFEHRCKDRGGESFTVAPGLAPAHVVMSVDPLTITPSLLCPDCGLHGFVTNGVWRPC